MLEAFLLQKWSLRSWSLRSFSFLISLFLGGFAQKRESTNNELIIYYIIKILFHILGKSLILKMTENDHDQNDHFCDFS